jgi:hypothetical protein
MHRGVLGFVNRYNCGALRVNCIISIGCSSSSKTCRQHRPAYALKIETQISCIVITFIFHIQKFFLHRPKHLCSESLGESAYVALNLTMRSQELNVGTINLDLASLTLLKILVTAEGSEAPVLGNNDLLAAGEPASLLGTYFGS